MGITDIDRVQPDAVLTTLGLDSLMALAVRNALAAHVDAPLPATLVYDHPTPAAIAALLVGDAPAPPVTAAPAPADEPIAIVGLGCRLPGDVADPDGYWRVLRDGVDLIGPFPARYDADALYDPDPDAAGRSVTRHGGFIDDLGIAPREAVAMDPQQRIFLQTAWEALERAGIDPTARRGGYA